MPENKSLPGRRTIIRTAAWSAPVIGLAAAAPAASASSPTVTPPGLQGWVRVTETCSSYRSQFAIDGVGSYPNRGLWVYHTTPATKIADPVITLYFPSTLQLVWTPTASNNGWSTPAPDTSVPPIAGMTAYTTRYSGAWSHVAGTPSYSVATGQPSFRSSAVPGNTCLRSVQSYALRSVAVDQQVVEFRRGPVTLGRAAGANSAAQAATTDEQLSVDL